MEITENYGEEPRLVVMLTRNDMTVADAREVFMRNKGSKAAYWGMKEEPLALQEMREIYLRMKEHGVRTVMEVVAYDEAGGLEGARRAAECGCDIVMGTKFHECIAHYCHAHGMKYMPFVGQIEDRPSVLKGSPDAIVAEALDAIGRGADGIDLLGYRYVGDASGLIRRVVAEVPAPVCIAGSIDSYSRLDEMAEVSPWGFTIGSAFFSGRFGEGFGSQIDNVINHISGRTK